MLSRDDCLREYGSDYFIKKNIKDGKLFQIGKAIYSKTKDVPYLAVLCFKYPNAVVTMRNAFYLHSLTDVIPDYYDLATDRNAAKIRDSKVIQFFLQSDILGLGVETIEYKGYKLNVYSKERMLIELIRYKSKLPVDYYKEILLNYRKLMPVLNIQKIQDYAILTPNSGRILDVLQTEVL